jgi:hypothetical protein
MNAEGPLIKSQRHTLKTLGVLTNCPKSAYYLSKVAGKIQTAEEPASSPLTASATFALKAGVWFRRGRLFIVSPDSRGRQAENPLIALFRFPEPALPSGILTPFPIRYLYTDNHVGEHVTFRNRQNEPLSDGRWGK